MISRHVGMGRSVWSIDMGMSVKTPGMDRIYRATASAVRCEPSDEGCDFCSMYILIPDRTIINPPYWGRRYYRRGAAAAAADGGGGGATGVGSVTGLLGSRSGAPRRRSNRDRCRIPSTSCSLRSHTTSLRFSTSASPWTTPLSSPCPVATTGNCTSLCLSVSLFVFLSVFSPLAIQKERHDVCFGSRN
ncbi:hypothetical protein BT93_J1718 [Corymbia citriodora subsp. variegata]|nr:hypothetical protein BT93_J1718 [Corymbia citriodora subsp. variegata]